MPAMLDADLELAKGMATKLRKLIEVLGVESKLGKSRFAEMTTMLSRGSGCESSRTGAEEIASSLLARRERQRRSRKAPSKRGQRGAQTHQLSTRLKEDGAMNQNEQRQHRRHERTRLPEIARRRRKQAVPTACS